MPPTGGWDLNRPPYLPVDSLFHTGCYFVSDYEAEGTVNRVSITPADKKQYLPYIRTNSYRTDLEYHDITAVTDVSSRSKLTVKKLKKTWKKVHVDTEECI